MVEPLVYAALGFLMASLLGLFVCRAVWNRAVRLTTTRVQRRLPLSREEITAGRDLLRAQQAVETRRLERHAETLSARTAASLADLGRTRAELAALRRDIADNQIESGSSAARADALRAELDDAAAEIAATRASLAAVEAERDRIAHARDPDQQEAARIRGELDARGIEIATLQAGGEGLREEIAELKSELASVYATLQERSELLTITQDAYARENERALAAEARASAAPAAAPAPVAPEQLAALREQIETLAGEIARQVSAPAKVVAMEGGAKPPLRSAVRAARSTETPVAASTER